MAWCSGPCSRYAPWELFSGGFSVDSTDMGNVAAAVFLGAFLALVSSEILFRLADLLAAGVKAIARKVTGDDRG